MVSNCFHYLHFLLSILNIFIKRIQNTMNTRIHIANSILEIGKEADIIELSTILLSGSIFIEVKNEKQTSK